ncbi:hypothetical protein GC169_06010 [bacterium]|nr:hypothetical protein [bacterium]
MLPVLKHIVEADARRVLTGRLGAWWDGRDYVPESNDENTSADQVSAPAPAKGGPEAPAVPSVAPPIVATADKEKALASLPAPSVRRGRDAGEDADPRVAALEALWGSGRLGPGSDALDACMLDAMFARLGDEGGIGFIGVDAQTVIACRERSERPFKAIEWREPGVERLRELAPFAEIAIGDVDRPRGLADASLAGLLTLDCFAFGDHKSGLVTRAHRALREDGRWVFLEVTRCTTRAPAAAFASAWAEPQVASDDEILGLLHAAGFASVHRADVGDLYCAAAAAAFDRIGRELDSVVSGAAPRLLQELSWEMQSARARIRAIQGGALRVGLWSAVKTEGAPNPFGEGAEVMERQDLPVPAERKQAKGPPKKAAKPATKPPPSRKALTSAAPPAHVPPTPTPAAVEIEEEAEAPEAMDQSAVDALFD